MWMLDRRQICDTVRNFPFSRDTFWLVMGGALVIYGIRDFTNDIDIGCTEGLFNQLKEEGYETHLSKSGLIRIDYSQVVHIYKNWMVDRINYIDDCPVSDLESIIKIKNQFGREKDIEDIALIFQYQERYK